MPLNRLIEHRKTEKCFSTIIFCTFTNKELLLFRDIVKLTAQFVARNGRQFLTQLMNREQRNFQFDFLRPQHSLFQYFTKLLEQYTKVLIPPKGMQQRLRDEARSMPNVFDQVKYRSEWHKYQEAQKAKQEEVLERERGKLSLL